MTRATRLFHVFLPFFERRVADVFVVGLVAVHRVMRQLEVRHDLPVVKDRRAGAGAEGQHHLDALALDRAKALHIGIVHHAHRLLPALGERGLQIETGPQIGAEIGRGQHPPVAHGAGEADRNAVEGAERGCRRIDRCGQRLGRDGRCRGRHADRLPDHPTVAVEQGELDRRCRRYRRQACGGRPSEASLSMRDARRR